MPDSPPSPYQLLLWLDDVIEGAWVDGDGRRVMVRDVAPGAAFNHGVAYLDVVPPEGWLSTAQVRYRITIEPGEVPQPDCARCPHPPHPAGMCEAPADDETSTCGCEETT